MKKIAIITDIHGNSPALKAVLQNISERNIDHIYCLGDVVGIGPDSNNVFDLLLSRNDLSYVMGNHDLAVIAAFHGEEAPRDHKNEREHHQWLADRIDPELIEFMSKWFMQSTLTVFRHQLLFTHYHLKDNWFAPIDKVPSVGSLDKIYKDTKYKLVCFGHHHIVHHYVSAERHYFNPGSLGCYHKPLARYGIVTLTENEIVEELIEVPYDNKEFLASYHRFQVPEREFILKVFHGGQL